MQLVLLPVTKKPWFAPFHKQPKPLRASDVCLAAAAGTPEARKTTALAQGQGRARARFAACRGPKRVTADAGETVGIWLESGWNPTGI